MEDTQTSIDKFTPTLKEALNKIAQNENFEEYDIVINTIPTLGGSYSGDLFAVDVVGKTPEGDRQLNLFVKKLVPETVEKMGDFGSLHIGYTREAYVYNELSKIFVELQNKYKVPQEERYKMVKGYDGYDEALILENAAKKGYKTDFRTTLISYGYAKLALDQLAKFHAFSFVLKMLKPKVYHEILTPMKPIFKWSGFKKNLQFIMTSTVQHLEDIETRKKALDFIPEGISKMQKYYEDDTRTRVLCHGDYRMNNTLIKRMGRVVTEVIPVDYQTIYFGCPVFDILYLIYTGTDRKFREAHLSDLLDVYYNSMERFLGYFNIKVKDVFPREMFLKDFEECRDYGLLTAMMIMTVLLTHDEDVIDLSKDDLLEWKPKVHESFQKRLGDIVNEFL